MRRFEKGDRVRIDIPDQSDPDYELYHDEVGEIAGIIDDDAGRESGDPRDNHLFRVRLENGDTADFRWRDLRPASSNTD